VVRLGGVDFLGQMGWVWGSFYYSTKVSPPDFMFLAFIFDLNPLIPYNLLSNNKYEGQYNIAFRCEAGDSG
jgi:hypothetical protein